MSRFGHTKTRKGDLHDRTSSSLDLMPPARVIAGPRALLTSILLVTRVPCRGSGAGGRTLAYKQRLAAVGRSQVPPARLTHRAPNAPQTGPDDPKARTIMIFGPKADGT